MKRKVKTLILSILAAVTVVFTIVPAMLTEAAANGISASSQTVQRGKEITITISAPAIESTCYSFDAKFSFNANAFQVMSYSVPVIATEKPTVSDELEIVNTNGRFAFGFASADGFSIASGYQATVTFQAKDNASIGNSPFKIIDLLICDEYGDTLYDILDDTEAGTEICEVSVTEAAPAEFLPTILGCKILKGDIAANQSIRADIDFSALTKAQEAGVTITSYGVVAVKYTNSDRAAQFEILKNMAQTGSTSDGSDGRLVKTYTQGSDPGVMNLKINGISEANYGKGFALAAFAIDNAGNYYYSDSTDEAVGLKDGMLLTSVRGVMKRILADDSYTGTTPNGYGYMLNTAIQRYVDAWNAANTGQALDFGDVENELKGYLGLSGYTAPADVTKAKEYLTNVFYYCYTPNETAATE